MSSPLRGLWRHADFLKLWAGQTASLFGSLIGGFAYNLAAIITLHASAEQIAVLNGCNLVPGMLVGPWTGVAADRLRRRPLLILADLGRALALASVPAAALAHRLTMPQLYAVAGLVSVLTVLFDVSYRAYVPALVGRENLIEGNSKLQATAAVAEAGGFGVSGLLVQLFTAPIAIAFDAVSFLVSALSLASIRHRELAVPRVRREAGHRWWHDLRDGARAVRRDAVLRALAITRFAWDLVDTAVGVVIMLFFVRDLRLAPTAMAPVFGIGGISAFGGALLARRLAQRWGLGRALIGSMYADGLGLVAVAPAAGPLPLVLTLLALGQCTDGGRTVYEVHSTSLVQSRAPEHLAGRINASFGAVGSAAMLLGLVLGGVLGQSIGLRPTLFVALACRLFVPLCLVFSPVRAMTTVQQGDPVETVA